MLWFANREDLSWNFGEAPCIEHHVQLKPDIRSQTSRIMFFMGVQ
jgi:hypothetical protein